MRKPRATPAWSAARLCCAALAVACGAKQLPSYLTQANAEHPKYHRQSFVTAVGISTQSADDASLAAKREVSSQISSQLKSATDSFMSATVHGNSSSESQRITSRTQVTTSFDRADLIDVVERDASDGTWYALGVLEKKKADAEYARAQKADLYSFGQFVAGALESRRLERPGDFNTAKSKALKLMATLEASFILRRAITEHPALEEKDFGDKVQALLAAAADADRHRVVQVRVAGQDSPTLLRLAVGAVRKLNLRVAEGSCEQAGEHQSDATELALLPEEACSEGSLGERCEVAVRLHARGCGDSGAEGEGRTPQMRGVHPSDRARARTSAWNKLTPETIETAVNEALRGAQLLDDGGAR